MSFAVASISLMGAGVAMQTIGARSSAMGQQNALNGQADLSETNARLFELGAQSSILAGQRQSNQIQLKAGQVKGAQTASMAANGIDLGSGSAQNILTTTDVMKEVDVNTTMANALRTSWGYKNQETNAQNDANIKRSLANAINPNQIALATLIDGAGKVAGNWYSLNKVGAMEKDMSLMKANMSSDGIGSYGGSQGWWTKNG